MSVGAYYVVADLRGNLVDVHRSEDTEPTFLSSVFEFIPLHILDQFGCAGCIVSAFDVVYSSSGSSLDSLTLTRLGFWNSCVSYCTCILKNKSCQLLVGLFSKVGGDLMELSDGYTQVCFYSIVSWTATSLQGISQLVPWKLRCCAMYSCWWWCSVSSG